MAGTRDFENLRFLKKCPGPMFQKPAKEFVFENAPLCPVFNFSKTRNKIVVDKIQTFEQLPKSQIPLLAIHKIISHIWEDRSRKVNNDEPGLRFVHGNF